jgi:hypothetical protein
MTSTDELLRIELIRITHAVQRFALWLRPDGGQDRSRRNAWSGLAEDRRRREERAEAERSAEVALLGRRASEPLVPEQYSPERAQVAVAG